MQTSKETISMSQLVVILITFELGSAILVGLATEAQQDGWIAVGIATLLALVLALMYITLVKSGEGRNIFQLMEEYTSRSTAIVFTLLYTTYFMYMAGRVMRDLIELLDTAVYPATPNEFIAFTFIPVVGYVLYLGIEPFARTAELMMPYMVLFFALMLVLLIVNRSIQLPNLLPLMPEGFGRIWNAAVPKVLTFPFGELIALTVIMAQVNKPHMLRRVTLGGIAASGLILVYVSILQITVLTPYRVSRSTFPLLSVNRYINVGYLFERLDGVVVFLMLIGVFIKTSVYFYAGLKGVEFISGRPYRAFIAPGGVLVALASLLCASDYMEHLKEGGEQVVYFLHIPFQLVLPFLLWGIVMLRRKKRA